MGRISSITIQIKGNHKKTTGTPWAAGLVAVNSSSLYSHPHHRAPRILGTAWRTAHGLPYYRSIMRRISSITIQIKSNQKRTIRTPCPPGLVTGNSPSFDAYPEAPAAFRHSHPDRKPLGDMSATLETLVAANPGVDFRYEHRAGAEVIRFDTREVKRS